MLTAPAAPTATTTRFPLAVERTKLTFETTGLLTPAGHAVRYPWRDGSATVTFNTTAVAPAGTTPPMPATLTLTAADVPDCTGWIAAFCWGMFSGAQYAGAGFVAQRVSRIREGTSGEYRSPAGAAGSS